MQDAVKNKLNPPSLSNLSLMGPIGKQMDIFLYERVLSDFAKQEIYGETEEKFRLREDDKHAVGMWRGEFWGKWVISACRVCQYKRDEELKAFLLQAALNLIATADPNGYIGTYQDPLNCFSPDPEAAMAAVGWPCKWNWNIWCRKYTLWGLMEVYQLTKDERVLLGAKRTTDQMLEMLKENHIRLGATGTFSGLPSCSILKPMLLLYRATEEKKYLDFCLEIAQDWNREDDLCPNLIKNGLKNTPVHTWYPQPEHWAKAYEMMSCLDGLLELYRVTGNEDYFVAVKNIYHQLKEHEGNAVFSVGFNDLFLGAAKWENSCSEPCDVLHWMRVCYELYTLTGDPEYMDVFEQAFLNPFLAASFADGKWGARAVRSAGRHQVATFQSSMNHSHCCVNNMPRGYMNACQAFVIQGEQGIYVNMYTDFACTMAGITLEIGGSYLMDGHVEITAEVKEPTVLFLRIPSWSKKTLVNDSATEKAGTYHAAAVPAGKSVLSIQFDMNPRLREMDKAPLPLAPEDLPYRRFIQGNDIPADIMTWDQRASLLYGPLLLARSKRVGSTEEEMYHSPSICQKGYACQVTPVQNNQVRNAYKAVFIQGDERVEMMLCDYATGTNHWSQKDPLLFNIYL